MRCILLLNAFNVEQFSALSATADFNLEELASLSLATALGVHPRPLIFYRLTQSAVLGTGKREC